MDSDTLWEGPIHPKRSCSLINLMIIKQNISIQQITYISMGNCNDQVQFEEVDPEIESKKKKDYRIFSQDYIVTKIDSEEQICSLPECQCPLEKHEIPYNFKLCTVCTNKSYKNFRRLDDKNKMEYQKDDRNGIVNKLPTIYDRQTYVKREEAPMVSQPPAAYYYNAWSLPIQKCQAERAHKPITDTNFTANLSEQQVHYSSHQSQASRPNTPPKKPIIPVPVYDYDRVDSRNKFQNLFLHDKYKI